uniref:Lines protein n=1 Tax=Schizaphis graminum TaxID=13262 RepID=A0A2S2NYA5_SCHGA
MSALPSDMISHLSAMRLLLSTRRRRRQQQPVADSNCCPTVERACTATLSNTTWFDQLLAVLASEDDHVRYVAVCVVTEAVLGCADDDGDSLAHLIDKILLTITTATGRSPVAAINVLTRVLDAKCDSRRISTVRTCCRHGGEEVGRFTPVANVLDAKTLLMDRLNEQWSDVVNTVACENGTTVAAGRDNYDLIEIVRLWTAVFRSFRSAGSAYRNHDQFFLELPSLEWLLYRTDTESLVWLNTVRLFGGSLQMCTSRTTDDWRTARSVALAECVLTGFTRRRLLYFMGKIASGFGPNNGRMRVLLQETVLLAMRSLRAFVAGKSRMLDSEDNRDTAVTTMIRNVVDCLDSYVKASTLYTTDVEFCRWSVRLMSDRDDATIECLTCALDIADAVPDAQSLLDPFAGFAELLECVSYEPDVLLDYLISDESDFLRYALRVLKAACRDALRFFYSFGTGLDDAMGLLIRLRLKMLRLHENRVFPYNVMPIAKLLQRCDELYTKIVS